MNTHIPYLRVVVGASLLAVAGYLIFSGWAVFYSTDAALRGDVIGTWKSFAVLAFGFWLGSSSGGKASPDSATQDVKVVNKKADAVPTTPGDRP